MNTESAAQEDDRSALDSADDEDFESPFEQGLPCPRCRGEGRVREWSNFFAAFAIGGFAGALYLAYAATMAGRATRFDIRFIVILSCLGVFGLYGLLDRGDCKRCGGMGFLEEDESLVRDDPADAEWASTPPPE